MSGRKKVMPAVIGWVEFFVIVGVIILVAGGAAVRRVLRRAGRTVGELKRGLKSDGKEDGGQDRN